jgi:hypothetical protein
MERRAMWIYQTYLLNDSEKLIKFFYDHAGSSHNPSVETLEQGRLRGAKELAIAAYRAIDEGLSFEWNIDLGDDSSSFNDDPDPWQLWYCWCRDADGKVVASLCSIDFGRDGAPWEDPYRRVVEAELAQEYFASVADESR